MKPQGLYYFPNLAFEVDIPDKWETIPNGKRLIQQYGYEYNYNSYKVKKINDIPELFNPLLNILKSKCEELGFNQDFNQCLINKYEPGEGITKHIDSKVFGDIIGCFSLGHSYIKFSNNNSIFNQYIEDHSLYIMSGDSRYLWKHEMEKRKSDTVDNKRIMRETRISITFRLCKSD